MIIWLDDLRPPPAESTYIKDYGYASYKWCHSVNEAIREINSIESYAEEEEYLGPYIAGIDCDHDLGDYAHDGGDGIKLLDWLEEKGLSYRIGLHTMNPVGLKNMEAIIKKNGWRRL